MKACDCFKQVTSCPVAVSLAIIGASVLALAGAYTAQFAYNLDPCILCMYQRAPYAAAILLGLIALLSRKNHKIVSVFVFLSALVFALGAAIAVYHVGVEQKWWMSAVEGCKAVFDDGGERTLLDQIMNASNARCDEVAWKDPVLGVSMAGWNIVYSLLLAAGCSYGAIRIRQRPAS